MTRIPVYFMPGLAASSLIFERISLDKEKFEMFFLEWEIPQENETLVAYANRVSRKILHPNPVLIGVSFGGILVQEIASFVNARKVIIISSVKCNAEFPVRMKIAKTTKAYKLIPTKLLQNIENLAKFSFGGIINQRIELYKKFLTIRDKSYLEWAIKQVVLWDRIEIDPKIVHIHGDQDDVFPIKNIKNCIIVKGASHIMILNKYKWLNENLPKIILE